MTPRFYCEFPKRLPLGISAFSLRGFLIVLLMTSSPAFASTYHVRPNGSDQADGMSSPWRTIGHAVRSVPAGDHLILLSPGTYVEDDCLDFTACKSGSLTIQSEDSANPAVITASGDRMVVRLAGNVRAVKFQEVTIAHPSAASLVQVGAKDIHLAFEGCFLSANADVIKAAAEASGMKLEIQRCTIKAQTNILGIPSAVEVALRDCILEWEDGPFLRGRPRSILFEKCTMKGSPTTLVLNAGGSGSWIDRVEFALCSGSCGRLLWEQGGGKAVAHHWEHHPMETHGYCDNRCRDRTAEQPERAGGEFRSV